MVSVCVRGDGVEQTLTTRLEQGEVLIDRVPHGVHVGGNTCFFIDNEVGLRPSVPVELFNGHVHRPSAPSKKVALV